MAVIAELSANNRAHVSLAIVLTTPDVTNTCCGNFNSQEHLISGSPVFVNLTPMTESAVNSTPAMDAQGVPLQWGMLGLTLIIMCTAVGNLLVCLAVCWEKRLQNMTNYFLMSLAIADFLVSLLVMPLGMVVEIFGHFPMNSEICVLWVASDVLMCSASIWHMCTMSMDRYFTLKYPMRYGRNKTRRMVAGKILFVWVVSVAISSPVCIHGFIDTASVFRNGECVPTVKNFVIYGSIFAFYIPLLIMIVTYVLTIRILWKNQQRMRHIDRSDLKPRLAQLTAQCTGFAIPKLLSSLRKPRKPQSSQAPVSRIKTDKLPLSPVSAGGLSNKNITNGNVNNIVNTSDLGEGGDESRKSHVGMRYLAPPSPQAFMTRSPTPTSLPFHINSDTEESDSEPNYFSLLQTSHSSRSLYSPISHNASEKSLHRRLQKKQLYQQQQQELQLLRQEYHQQRATSGYHEDNSPSLPTPLEDKLPDSLQDNAGYSTSAATSPSPPPSPLFDEDQQDHHQQHLLSDITPYSTLPATLTTISKLSRNPSTKDVFAARKLSKKKRYSKKCKRRRNSLNQPVLQGGHLKVPPPVYFKRGRSCKQSSGHTALVSAVSDTLVSHAGRCGKSFEEHDQDMSSFHLSYSNLSKDYKSVEWDRRYFQIQEEMDRCLEGEFGRNDKGQPRHEQISESQPDKQGNSNDSTKTLNQKTLLKPEVSLPLYLTEAFHPHGVDGVYNGYSHSAPNSPLNRRNSDQMKLHSSSDDDEREDFLEDDDTLDKNVDEDNETSESSNSDVITIRLHPPSPKAKPPNNVDKNQTSNSNIDINNSTQNSFASSSLNTCPTVQYFLKSENMTEMTNFSNKSTTNASKYYTSATTNAASLQSLSPGGSPLPEVVISSEGEMTLEETDDTLDDSPKHQRIKLRRPHKLQSNKYKFRKREHSPQKTDSPELKNIKPKRPSFRNTFRIHRGKGPVKHILSKKTASNEKKASKVLGIIFLVFVVLWTPFFAANILGATCTSCMKDVTKEMMSLFLWMGYIASLANPIIYTMFNTAFRRTFVKILTCKIQRTCRAKGSDNHYISYTTMLVSERRNTVTVVLRDESK